ncbi:MAG: GNAT family N-acetyltransferase [Nodularia sp. (in: Bacteria)]|nr:MAG: GNAT family N-acetyltransferase [Nodularia sp. (in: cyanobacteria)]
MFNPESLKIIQTTDIVDFIPLLQELEFGDQFSLSMLKWCGIGQRDQSISFWQVYITKLATESIGVMGLYQLIDSPANVVWMGWFGLRPHFRRQGWGTKMIHKLKEYALSFQFQELWVFTNYDNLAAISFYENYGFIQLGEAADICPGKTHELSDIILKYTL